MKSLTLSIVFFLIFLISTFGQVKVNSNSCLGVGIADPWSKLDLYGSYARFDYIYADLWIKLANADPRIMSDDSKIVFYRQDETDHIDIEVDDCFETSDSTLKTEIEKIESALDVVTQLEGVTYSKKNDPDGPRQSGLIAQEVEKVLPGAVVSNDSTGIRLLSYSQIIPYLIEAIKEQQAELESLRDQISFGSLEITKYNGLSSSHEIDIPGVSLFQNTPNPFHENTVIRYSIPNGKVNATINVYDLQGSQVRSYHLLNDMNSELIIPGAELTPGIYLYNLIVDSQVIDTKQMILTN